MTDLRASQQAVEVITTPTTPPSIQVSQFPIEVLTSTVPPSLQLSQQAVEVLQPYVASSGRTWVALVG